MREVYEKSVDSQNHPKRMSVFSAPNSVIENVINRLFRNYPFKQT